MTAAAIIGLALSIITAVIMIMGPLQKAKRLKMGMLHIELFVLAIFLNAIQSAAAFETSIGNEGALLAFCSWWGIPIFERLLWLGVAFHLVGYYRKISMVAGEASKHIEQ